MTGRRGNSAGRIGVKVVRKRLADGSVKEYRYDRTRAPRIRIGPGRGGIHAIAKVYVLSPEFRRLSARWQVGKRHYLGVLEDELGWMTIADLSRREARGKFYDLRDRFADKPNTADKLMATLAGLLAWAEERGKIERNRAVGIANLAPTRPRAEIVWTEDDEAAAYATFPPAIGRALRLAILTGIRQADMCALRWEQYRDGWIRYRPSKTAETTGALVLLPVFALDPLRILIDELGRGTEFMLTSEVNHPWTADNLRAQFLKAKRRSPLAKANLHWHDLRGTAISRLYRAGCTDAEVASISGHALGGGSAIGDYAARSPELAENAFRKLNRWLAERPSVIDLDSFRGPQK